MTVLSRFFILSGLILILIGGLLHFVGKIPWVGRLPGDIFIKKENFIFYFPLASSVIVSIILSILLFLWHRK